MEEFKKKLIEFGFKPCMLEDEERLKKFYDGLDKVILAILMGETINKFEFLQRV